MTTSAQNRWKAGPTALLARAFVPWLLVSMLVRFDVMPEEWLAYLAPLCFLTGLPAAMAHWRGIDEPSREAHKFAYFWGMGSGVAIAILLAIEIAVLPGAQALIGNWIDGFITEASAKWGQRAAATGFYLGIMACALFSFVAYFIVWLCWWAYQRAGSKPD